MDYEAAREELADRLARREGLSEPTIAAMKAVPRHAFVPESRRGSAYADRPLPIGDDQTISAPHMVAIMTDLLGVEAGDSVLEIGTGCGYHAAVTSEVVGPENVYSVEFSSDLAGRARETLERIGYGRVGIRQGDGRAGWPENAPYEAAYFTCAVPEIPDDVAEQVRSGGTVLAPVGEFSQRLVRARVGDEGIAEREAHGAVRFVSIRG
ncbi:protein-L-isoaspartate(D-aspartate) O-methyltransferase [Halalkalicoccus sp. NIPERK01]|uniref:protein-L-isoaspartate(D-aspartate) O-methyltransferase n=1 Tax=Halalkalicoccus sp. NIPERK01 TaxID=3053469 RepID=UPI00256EABC0|nr:protein-L-isoaspartate(D-aspartate) O-methyltransferase [Halalkalicoccus sp. NIPERK01]MDL5362010.1 protein-L-isoaspartate(D-aspartate) O-methyltransferase [Halalkalicoccus sp. NIPERK01]